MKILLLALATCTGCVTLHRDAELERDASRFWRRYTGDGTPVQAYRCLGLPAAATGGDHVSVWVPVGLGRNAARAAAAYELSKIWWFARPSVIPWPVRYLDALLHLPPSEAHSLWAAALTSRISGPSNGEIQEQMRRLRVSGIGVIQSE